ncbi:MAG: AAA family ATPase [Phycisphaerales bacterium]|nr:AAA family ATPase [Phycisphaerales bacterium]
MSSLKLAVFDAGASAGDPFVRPFETCPDVEIVGQFSRWDDLQDWVRQGASDIVAVNLDDEASTGITVVERIVRTAPGCGIIGVSRATDPASIIGAMRAGCTQFVCWPIDPEDLRSAVNQIRATRLTASHRSQRICVIPSSGGAGATTVACNLAMELAHLTGHPTALVDMNVEFGDVASAFDVTPKYSLADVCREGMEPDRVMLGQAMLELPCHVSVLARPESLEDAHQVNPANVERTFRLLAEMFPTIVVDMPRGVNALNQAALHRADKILIVTQLGVPFVRNAMRIRDCLLQVGIDEDALEIVLNRCQGSFERLKQADVEQHFGKPCFAVIPNDYKRVMTALDLGHPIVADAPNSPARLAIQEMARRFVGADKASGAASGDGLLGKLFGRKAKAGAARS